MGNAKPEFLYRGVIVNEKLLKEKQIYGIDLTPPNPPKYDEQGRKTVGDGNEYGVYMSDYKEVATNAYAAVSMKDGTPLNNNVRIGERSFKIAVPAVGIVYKISTNGLDVHKPWITSSLKGHYNNGFMGDEWVAERIPVGNYVVEKVIVGEDILHPKKEIEFSNQEEILIKINEELEERKKRLEKFEEFIELLPQNQVLRMMSDELDVYKEIYKKDGLNEFNLETFKISDCSDCIKLMMAYYYQNNNSSLPMYELKYLNKLQSIKDFTFLDFDKCLLNDLKNLIDKRNSFAEKQRALGNETNTNSFDKRIEALIQMQRIYLTLMINQIIMSTGIMFNEDIKSIVDLRKQEGIFNKKLEEMYYDGELSIQLYQAMKKKIRETTDNKISTLDANENEISASHIK